MRVACSTQFDLLTALILSKKEYFVHQTVVVHLSDHNPVMVAQVDYHIRAEQSINGKETTEYIHKVSMI